MTTSRIRARRDCPEIIVPAGVVPGQLTAGLSWAPGAKANIATAAQWNIGRLLVGFEVNYFAQFTVNIATPAGSQILPRQIQYRFYADQGLGAVQIAQCATGLGAFMSWTGWVADPIQVKVGASGGMTVPIVPRYFPPGTLLQYDGAQSDGGAAGQQGMAIAYAYDPDDYAPFEVPVQENDIGGGGAGVLMQPAVLPSMANVSLTPINTWVEITAALDGDYLIDGCSTYHSNPASGSTLIFNGEMGTVGAAGTPAATQVQARFAGTRNAVQASQPVNHHRFPEPFIVYGGERLMARYTYENIAGATPSIIAFGRKL